MIGLAEIAKRIPDKVRTERLLVPADPIQNAQPYVGNRHMTLLYAVWYEFIEPGKTGDANCPSCLNRIHQNFIAIKEELIKLEKDYKLLQSLKK